MRERAAVIEIEKRTTGEYRVELRDRGTERAICSAVIDGSNASETAYKHVCKVRVPAESEPTIGLESDRGEDRVVLRANGQTYYRHELPTPVSVAN